METYRQVGIIPKMACHDLKMNPKIKPKMQRRLSISTETYKALKIDMDKLLENSFICDAQYCSDM